MLEAWRGIAQARSDSGACLDGARCPRYAGDDRLCRPSQNRSAKGWGGHCRCGASGAVGSIVGQITKIKGCYAVGIAGGAEKCRFVADELGFDACVDHRASDFANSSKPLVPRRLTSISRTSAAPCSRRCSRYSTILRAFPYAGSSRSTTRRPRCPGPTCFRCCANASSCVGSSSQISPRKQAEFLRDVGEWVRTGRLKYREDIVKGLENAPASFLGMLQGKNFGKTW